MALPANYINARVVYRSPQKEVAINVLWYDLSGEPADPSVAATSFATAIGTAIGTEADNILTTASNFLGVQVALTTGGGTYVAFTGGGAVTGLVAGDELPSYAAVLIQKRTGAAGRPGRGRWYIPFVPELLTNEGIIEPGSVAAYDDLGIAYFLEHTEGGVTATPAHYSPTDDVLYPILSVQVVSVLATQRRRRLRQSY